MATIPAGVITAWPSTVASIPAHWTRVAALDGRYPSGAATGVNPFGSGGTPAGVQGGAATHTHAEAGHTHALGNHSHGASGTTGSPSATVSVTVSGASAPTQPMGDGGHTHTLNTSPSVDAQATDSPGWDAETSDVPVNESVIWLQSDGNAAVTGFPANALVYWYQQQLPTAWTQLTATVGGVLQPVYLVGAATGLGGGTQGGAGRTGHSHAGVSHTHSYPNHGHGGASTNQTSTAISGFPVSSGGVVGGGGHAHGATYNTVTVTAAAAASPQTSLTVPEPPYQVITIIKNATGATSLPAYAIALWLGTLAAIPAGWSLCDGTNGTPDMRGLFARGSVNLSDIGATGGSLGHSHTPPTTGHAHDATHSHTITVAADTETGIQVSTAGVVAPTPSHGHTAPASTSYVGLNASAAPTLVDAADTRPPYTDVAFICYTAAPTVSITSPAGGVLSIPTALVQWAFDVLRIQVDYRLQVFAADGVTVVYDSGTVVNATQQATIPVGYLQDSTSYRLQVTATDSGHQQAVSAQVSVSTSWTQPPTPGVGLSTIGGSA